MDLTRMSAAGNVFYLALGTMPPAPARAELARAICAGEGVRGVAGDPGAPADGLIFGAWDPPSQRMHNPDGSEGLCANGLRCLARLLAERGLFSSGSRIATLDGPKRLSFTEGSGEGSVEVGLGRARDLPEHPGSRREGLVLSLAGEELRGYGVWLGNPHFVLLGDAATQARLSELGPAIERHPAFPDRANVELAVAGAEPISVRAWERGAGETLSCGTGAAAVAVAGPDALRPCQSRRLRYPGGELRVRMDEGEELFLSGPVRELGSYRYVAPVEPGGQEAGLD